MYILTTIKRPKTNKVSCYCPSSLWSVTCYYLLYLMACLGNKENSRVVRRRDNPVWL